MDFSHRQRELLLNVARSVIRGELAGDPPPPPPRNPVPVDPDDPHPDPALHQAAGCFVSLHALRTHRLRGCVGRLDATSPLLAALRGAALSVLDDPRFVDCPVCLEELSDLSLEISVVSPLRPVAHPLDFDPARDGIYLTLGGRSGCFLPQVARETGWGREKLLDRLCTEKMDLPAGRWRHAGAQLSIFSTVTIGPEPFVPQGSMTSERDAGGESGRARLR